MNTKRQFGIYCEMQADPEKDHGALTWEVMELIEVADKLGYDTFSLIEHHFYPQFGISANPLAMFAAAAQKTERIRFRTLCHILPFHHPLILAGEIAVADILTKGRLECGFGRGHGWLYPPSGLLMQESKGRYQEALEIIPLAFTEKSFPIKATSTIVRMLKWCQSPCKNPTRLFILLGRAGQVLGLPQRKVGPFRSVVLPRI